MPTVTVNKNADTHHGPFWIAVESKWPHIARRHLARFEEKQLTRPRLQNKTASNNRSLPTTPLHKHADK